MSTEDEFSKWLRRKEKTFEENFKFALKSWQSVEFTLNTKYQIILQWLSEQDSIEDERVVGKDFEELFKLRAQPGLLNQDIKEKFVEWTLQMASNYNNSSRKWVQLLTLLLEFEPLQDIFRTNYTLLSRVYERTFVCYEKYLINTETSEKSVLSSYETEFFASILGNIKKTIKRCGDLEKFENVFSSISVNSLVNVVIFMRSYKVDFFEELLEIERLLCTELDDNNLMKRIMKMPLHVRLLVLECAIINRRGIDNFLELLLSQIFLSMSSEDIDPVLSVTVAAYTIEMLSRHSIKLSFGMSDGQTVLQFLGKKIVAAVQEWKDSHLKDVLMLLCAVLRLNPLILEEHVFQITVWMMLSNKSGDLTERHLFEEYLVLLMDMFRRLSRAEKFVGNLIKTLTENVKDSDLVFTKKRKNKASPEGPPLKKRTDSNGECIEKALHQSKNYLNVLFQDFFQPVLSQNKSLANSVLSASASFPKLYDYWPSNPVGVAFSKIVMGLVSKPSLVICKTLLYSLKNLIANFSGETELSEKSLFLLDFHTALLVQYLTGCKLAEQSDKFLEEIASQRQFLIDVLQSFGKCLLGREHNPRTMSAFLEISYYATCFELMLTYYRPDGCNHETLMPTNILRKLHCFLSPEEWTLIKQRVLNFGKSSCKYLLQRLDLQKSQSAMLLTVDHDDVTQLNATFDFTDNDTLNALLKDINSKWLVEQMSSSEKVSIAEHLLHNDDLLFHVQDDLKLLEFVTMAAYEHISSTAVSKHSLLKSISCDYNKVRQSTSTSDYETLIKELVDVIITKSNVERKVKILDADNMKAHLNLLSRIPIGHLRRQQKTIAFALHLSLYHDLKSAQEEELAAHALDILKDILHFGQQVLIFKYFSTSDLIKLLPPASCWELYEYIFSTLKNEEKGTDNFLQGLVEILQESITNQNFDESQRRLLLSGIDSLSTLSGPCAKRMRKYLDLFFKIFFDYLSSHFDVAVNNGNSKKDKKFVQRTLSGFAPYASAVLTRASKTKDATEKETDTSNAAAMMHAVDDVFRRICKIYIGHSMDYRNPCAIRLMHVALNYRDLLHLDQDEIEFVLTTYWNQISEDLKSVDKQQQSNNTMESAVKIIIGNKTNEDLLIILKTMADNAEAIKFSNILSLLSLIAKCPLSTIKGAIFNEQYKKITFNITLRLNRDEQQLFKDHDLVIQLLQCHQAILDNRMVPISLDTMDSILSFLMDINVKKFNLYDNKINIFNSLHLAMTDVCSSLIKQRHILLMDRVPQYIHVFKDLTQSVVWYKSDRQKDTALPSEEMDALSELAMKLESLMRLIAQHSVGVKRVAPFVLTSIINLMVANKRPTTLYNKIKTHIENICYELIGICDHRVGRFILRCSNEAGRQLYELLVKDYQKYHKFKGKV